MIRQAKKAADEQRVIEKKPHDDAAKAVQTKYKPLIDKCELAASVAKKALVPWLEHLEAEQRADAERQCKEADEARKDELEEERAANDSAEDEQAAAASRVADKVERAGATTANKT